MLNQFPDSVLRMTIDTGNDAFVPCPQAEVARILREAAAKIESDQFTFNLRDYNGNVVGNAELIIEED